MSEADGKAVACVVADPGDAPAARRTAAGLDAADLAALTGRIVK
jgi:hypothetical protein